MNFNSVFKRETKIIAVVVICLTLVFIGGSYALFFQVGNNTENQVVQAGDLKITYANGKTILVNENDENNCLMPQTDTEALNTSCKFELSIVNEGTLPMQYNLLIGNNEDNSTNASFVDYGLIKHSLKKQYAEGANIVNVATAKTLDSLVTYKDNVKKVLEENVIRVGETIKFTLNIWIDDDASTEIIGQIVNLKLSVVGVVFEEEDTAVATLTSYMDRNGLEEVKLNTATYGIDSPLEKEYRYVGANPNNYVLFNEEKWRILGIYNVSNGSLIENRIKIIKSDATTKSAWDTNGGNDFSSSTLFASLNSIADGLTEDAKSYSSAAIYKLGGAENFQLNAKEMYAFEFDSTKEINAKVGIMSLSDYAFASGIKDLENLTNVEEKNSNNWLYTGFDEWFINSSSEETPYALVSGAFSTAQTTEEKLVRPVLYLASGIKLLSGDGTETNPYVLSK